jgi:hypothetical protein
MGWRERDWAKLRNSELEALCGFRRPSPQRRSSRHTVALMAVAIAVVVGVGYSALREGPQDAPTHTPAIIYGAPVTLAGNPTACTELAFNVARRGWTCLTFSFNIEHAPVRRAESYDGECPHLVADQQLGRWLCAGKTPTRPDQLPSLVLPERSRVAL